MTTVEARRGYGEQTLNERVTEVEAITGDPEDPFAVLGERKEHVAALFESGGIDAYDALKLGMYVSHGAGASRLERETRMTYMTDLLHRAQQGETALAVTVANCIGGVIDRPLSFMVDRGYGLTFAMDVPFAQMPDDPRLARIYLGQMLLGKGHDTSHTPPLIACDRLLVGADEIADFVKERSFRLLRDNPYKEEHLDVERDGKLLTGLYQAGITLIECGIEEETRVKLYEKLDTPLGKSMVRAHAQALHVVAMDRLT